MSELDQVYSVRAVDLDTGKHANLCYRVERACGYGSFGEVSQIRLLHDDLDDEDEARLGGGGSGGGQVYALKRTRQDRKFKNRELSLMRSRALRHPNIIECKYAWQERSSPQEPDKVILYLLLEYVPQTLFQEYRSWIKKRGRFPELLCKIYLFQLLRALAWCHALGVCHRDIKPHNILIGELLGRKKTDLSPLSENCELMIDLWSFPPQNTGRVVLIDFGSAKVLKSGEENITYTCSRYYRAPELIFGNTTYNHAVDMWSVGCVLAELLLGKVFFAGGTGLDQLVEIIKVIGTPTRAEVYSLNPRYQPLPSKVPQVKPQPLHSILTEASPESISLLNALFKYTLEHRITASQSLAHPFFDEIKMNPNLSLPTNGKRVEMGLLFAFSLEELSIQPSMNRRYIPNWYYETLYERTGVDLNSNYFRPVNLKQIQIDLN